MTLKHIYGGVSVHHRRITGDGITWRSWSTVGLPVEFCFSTVTQTAEVFYGPAGSRPPGLWLRVLRAVAKSNGRTTVAYCPDLPPYVDGFGMAVPRFSVALTWTTRRHTRTVADHFAHPCQACTAEGWRPADPAT
ncbi:hypothetical protein ACIP9H_34040 [Streptomyces sp. NPDC088732]|uniref:hypothetical protein n=1 Tax=Streptomyces sp. NPDC088732 TaxID=3365879 RepID=UPI0038029CBA